MNKQFSLWFKYREIDVRHQFSLPRHAGCGTPCREFRRNHRETNRDTNFKTPNILMTILNVFLF